MLWRSKIKKGSRIYAYDFPLEKGRADTYVIDEYS